MSGLMIISYESFARNMETVITLSTSGGYVSNSYLIPGIPDWDRREVSAYATLTPSANMLLTGTGRSLALTGTGRLMHITGERPDRAAGFLHTLFRQRITSTVSLRAFGGLNYYSTFDHTNSSTRNIQWFQAGLEWLVSPFARFEVMGGSGWRTYDMPNDMESTSSRYDSYGLGFEYWPGFRWRLRTDFHSSLAHVTNPGDGFTGFFSISRYLSGGAMIMLQTGLEQYSTEFQSTPDNGTGPPDFIAGLFLPVTGYKPTGPGSFSDEPAILSEHSESEIITLEDRFHRTSLQLSYPIHDRFTLTGTFSGLLWFSSEDDYIEPDFQFSAGLQVPFSIRKSRSGEVQSLQWKFPEPREATLTVRYRDDHALYITGDFINWDQPGIPLEKTGRNLYRVTLDLSQGVYDFKIVKRKNNQYKWLDLPENTTTISDGFGGRNGRVFIDY